MKKLNEMTSKELKELAKELKISNWWNLKKEVLIEKIEEAQNMTDEEKQLAAEQKAKEDEALAVYQKHWRKYTKTYNPSEFIEKFRSGKITLGIKEKTKAAKIKADKKAEDDFIHDLNENFEELASHAEETSATAEQLTPKRGALLEYNGKAQNICAWAEELGISPNTLYGRIYKMGWSIEKAFSTPSKKK